MNRALTIIFIILNLILCSQSKGFSGQPGKIYGNLILDDSWDRKIYVSHIKAFEKEFTVSNDLIIASSEIDSLGNFEIFLGESLTEWSFLRLHIVKKGVSPNSLVIGSIDENFLFLIGNYESKIRLNNFEGKPIFKNVEIEGADYMRTFDYIKKLHDYANSINYDKTLIEKEFIVDAISEKLKVIADSCSNPLVSLYAIYQTDFQEDIYNNPSYYENYLAKWEEENNPYLNSFRLKFPTVINRSTRNSSINYILIFMIFGIIAFAAFSRYMKRGISLNQLSLKEREIFELLRKGMSNKEISAECHIELSTVKSHISSIYSKLKIKSRKEVLNLKTRM